MWAGLAGCADGDVPGLAIPTELDDRTGRPRGGRSGSGGMQGRPGSGGVGGADGIASSEDGGAAIDRAATDAPGRDDAPAPVSPADATGEVPGPMACANPPCLNVLNNCPVPLWTHALAAVPLDEGRVRKLAPGERWQYQSLPGFAGGRLYAYYRPPAREGDLMAPVSPAHAFITMGIDRDGATGRHTQQYNLTFVDSIALPVAVKGGDSSCAESRCALPFVAWTQKLATCPTELREAEGPIATCVGSYNYCVTADGPATYDTTRPYCSKMQDRHGHPGSAIYGGVFPSRPPADLTFWDSVAAWNRGTTPGDRTPANYYRTEPFNHYARFVHHDLGCTNVYAFSTDDHQDQVGFARCLADSLTVTWCP